MSSPLGWLVGGWRARAVLAREAVRARRLRARSGCPREGVAGCACGAQPVGLGGLWPLGVPEAVEVVGLGHGVCKRLRRGAAALRVRFVTGSERASENLALRLES